MNKKKEQVSINALRLIDDANGSSAKVMFSDDGNGGKKPSLEMLAYSGGIIKDHWWWGDLAIDLQGMKFPKKTFPLLEDHRTDRKLGVIKKLSIEGNQLTVEEADLLDNADSLKFQSDSSQGFPFEASIYAQPTQIQRLMKDEVAEVNGYQMKGPGTIWRKSTFKEASVCTFGYDPNTKSKAMSEQDMFELTYTEDSKPEESTNEEGIMKFTEYKEKHPEEFAKLSAEITASIETKFAEDKAALETKLAEAQATNVKLSEDVTSGEKRLLALEKAEAIRVEQGIQFSADKAFTDKFAASGLPARLGDKIRKLVDHEQFVADGKLDIEAFKAAVDAELTDWQPKEGASDDVSIMGFSTSSKTFGEDHSKDCDAVAASMLKSIQ